MSEGAPRDPGSEETRPPKTPFDNPFFLPVLLWLATGWFFWDSWITPMEEHLAFNRYGFGFLLGVASYSTVSSLEEVGRVREIPYFFAGLMTSFALWLAYLGWLGPEGRWYSDGPWVTGFNRYGFAVFASCAIYSALRHRRREARTGEIEG